MGAKRKKQDSDFIGSKFHFLTPVAREDKFNAKNHRKIAYRCHCICGGVCVVTAAALDCGNTKSCGCLQDAVRRKVHTKHGAAANGALTPEYKVWTGIKTRCRNPNNNCRDRYYERGIKICAGWCEYSSFLDDMGPRPSDNHSIDRINNDGHYSCGHCQECKQNGWPSNCRWSTDVEQARNRRSNFLVECYGKSMTCPEWSEISGVKPATIQWRLKAGWSTKDSIFMPARHATS